MRALHGGWFDHRKREVSREATAFVARPSENRVLLLLLILILILLLILILILIFMTQKASEGAIYVASVTDVNDEHDEAILLDLIEDAVIPHADAVKVFLALELLRSGRM